MGHQYDGSSIDLEKALVKYMIEHRVTRRELLERAAKVGVAAAFAPIIAACTGGASAAPSSASSSAPSTAESATPSEPAGSPTPESELFIYNWNEYMGEDVIPSFEAKYNVKVTPDYFDNTDVAYAKLGDDGGGYDISFPISVDIPDFIAKGALIELNQSLLPNLANLGAEWSNPGYDPGNAHSIPYMWWTTGVGYAPSRVEGTPTSSKLLWQPQLKDHILMLDDWQEVFALALIQLGLDANTENPADLDRALALLEEQKPLVRLWSTNTTIDLTDEGLWAGHMWGADLWKINETREDFAYFIPEEGGVRGSDTAAIFSGAKHPIAAHLFLNHLLDAEVSASNTNYIGYMGPNAAAKAFIDPSILEDPTINPDQAIVDKLYELLDLGPTVRDEYLTRWQTLRGQ